MILIEEARLIFYSYLFYLFLSNGPKLKCFLYISGHTEIKEKLKCQFCCTFYNSKKARTIHTKSVHPGAKFICEMCKKIFKLEHRLTEHKKSYHVSTYTCHFCLIIFRSKADLKYHIIRTQNHIGTDKDKKYHCDTCGKGFFTSTSWNRHSKTHIVNSRKVQFNCSECTRQFVTKQNLNTHTKFVHGPRICNICNNIYNCREDLMVHKRTTHFFCISCQKPFPNKTKYEIHKSIHQFDNIRFRYCTVCDFKTETNITLKKHMDMHIIESKCR